MLSIFGLPKGFAGHTAVIQRNAITSWKKLGDQVEVLLFGDDPGVGDFAREVGARHVADVARTSLGTPLISDVFRRAQEVARFDVLCYANSDIILMSEFGKTINRVLGSRSPFLLAGRRTNLRVDELLDFNVDWEGTLRKRAAEQGVLQDGWWIDYFVFTRGLYTNMPPFAVGRPAWDNWLVFDTIRRRTPVIDATAAILAIHQDHDYGHVPLAKGDRWHGPEGLENQRLAGQFGTYCLDDATHCIAGERIQKAWSLQPLRRRLDRLEGGAGWTAAIARRVRSGLRALARGTRRTQGR